MRTYLNLIRIVYQPTKCAWFHALFHEQSTEMLPHLTMLQKAWTKTHPPSKFCGNPFSNFCIILLTNQRTNKWTRLGM